MLTLPPAISPSIHPSIRLSVCLLEVCTPRCCWNQIPPWESPPNCCLPAGMGVWEAENNQSHTVSPPTQTPASPAAPRVQPWAPKWRVLFGLCRPYKSEARILLSRDIISCDTIIDFSFYGPDESDILLIKWPRCLLMRAKRARDAHYASFSEAVIVLKWKSRFNIEAWQVELQSSSHQHWSVEADVIFQQQ